MSWIRSTGRDLRYALRSFARNPGAAVIAVFTLALGIGANVTLFSAVNAVLLRGLPFRDPSSLVFIYETRRDVPKFSASYPDYQDWRRQSTTFQEMAAYSLRDFNKPVLMVNGEPRQLTTALVSDNLFSLMSIQLRLGRAFLPEEGRSGRDQVVILSHPMWEQHFGSDINIVGDSVDIDGKAYTVVGVMSQESQFPLGADVWLPLSQLGEQDLARREARRVWVIGRLKPGVSEKQSLAELKSIASRLEQAYPEVDKGVGVAQVSLLDQYTGGIRTVLMVLLGAASLILLIACANIANLLLARAVNRKKEIAIRAAHGATRGRIFRQLLTESLGLAGLGTFGGLVVAYVGTALLKRGFFGMSNIPRLDGANIDATVLSYTIGVTVLTALLFGTLPAIQAARIDLNEALNLGGKGSGTATQGRLRGLLIIAEVAVAVTVLISTGLLVKSLAYLVRVDPGFRIDNLLTVQLRLSRRKYSEDGKLETFYLQLLERVKALPGVKGAATIDTLHIVPSGHLMHFGVDGAPPRKLAEYPAGQTRGVSPGYFDLMNIPIKRGSGFQEVDLAKSQRGVIINETLARTSFSGEDPIGRRIVFVEAPQPESAEIIGVAADVMDLGVDRAAEPEMYFLGFGSDEILLVYTAVDPKSLVPGIRQEVQSIDPNQPIGSVRTMRDVLDESFASRKLLASLMALFSGLALILTGVGIYGVVSFSVVQRTSEIGVRTALGATRLDIVHLLLRQGMTSVAVGLMLGLIGAWSVRKLLYGLLYGVSSTDAMTYVAVAALIALTAAFATIMASLGATRIDPMLALGQQ